MLSTLGLGLKHKFLKKLKIRVGSGDPELSLIYAAIGSDC